MIKDPAEYNAYVAAIQQKDPNAKISGLEAFLTQYPNSVMKNQASRNPDADLPAVRQRRKSHGNRQKLVAADPCQVPALTLLAYIDACQLPGRRPERQAGIHRRREIRPAGTGLPAQIQQAGRDERRRLHQDEGADDRQLRVGASAGALSRTKTMPRPPLTSRPPSTRILRTRRKISALLYPLALAYLSQTPPDYQNGIWYAARAAAVAPAPSQPGIEKYARSQYVKFHGSDEGWPDVLNAAKAGGAQVAIAPAPSPADQAHEMVTKTPPDKMDFATWEFVLTNGSQTDQDTVWNAIKGKAVQMNGTVMSTTPTEFQIAGSSDDIDAKKADITLKFEDKVPVRLVPKDGASLDFQGEPASYTPNPFMMVMEKGQLLRAKATAPATKKPATAPARKKPAAQ